MVKPDMLLTAEGGCLSELTPGCRDRRKVEAMDEINEITNANPEVRRLNGPKTRRFFDGDVPGEEEGAGEGGNR